LSFTMALSSLITEKFCLVTKREWLESLNREELRQSPWRNE
jgi:hypothetical protein